jgi:hypothetical protein
VVRDSSAKPVLSLPKETPQNDIFPTFRPDSIEPIVTLKYVACVPRNQLQILFIHISLISLLNR